MNLLSAHPPQRLDSNVLGETAHVFGDGLVGVLHHGAQGARQDTAVILLNAGMVQRMGPYRGGVQLARSLAGGGFPVFRFDQSGLGDSPLSPRPCAELRQAELQAAMDLVARRTGAQRFVVGGICSAADQGFQFATIEPRIHGVLLLDGLAYRTWGYWWRYLLPRLLRPGKLLRWWQQRGAGRPALADFRDFPTRKEAATRLRDMVSRDVRLLFVFTGGAYGYFNHARQLSAALGKAARSAQVCVDYWPDCDHTFYLQRDRRRLQQDVLCWLQREFGMPAAGHSPEVER